MPIVKGAPQTITLWCVTSRGAPLPLNRTITSACGSTLSIADCCGEARGPKMKRVMAFLNRLARGTLRFDLLRALKFQEDAIGHAAEKGCAAEQAVRLSQSARDSRKAARPVFHIRRRHGDANSLPLRQAEIRRELTRHFGDGTKADIEFACIEIENVFPVASARRLL